MTRNDVYGALESIAQARRSDPLAPVTVVVPSHAAGLQLRRRLAEIGPFAAVRFETLPRLAELIGAGHLAGQGRMPLARPIGDYIAERVALESRAPLDSVRDVAGYARVLRQIFRRLRRGGIRVSGDVRAERPGHLDEVLRLYDLFQERTRQFYSDEDLLDAAALVVRSGGAGVIDDLGDVYIVPPGPQTAAGSALLQVLKQITEVHELEEPVAEGRPTFVIASDPASEAKEAVRLVLEALDEGTPLHQIAVFHGATREYPRLLREAFAVAGVTAVPLPGVPVSETRAGRGVLALARLPGLDYSRTAVIDLFSVAPVLEWLPSIDGPVHESTTVWDMISREAAVTRGEEVWSKRLGALVRERSAAIERLKAIEDEGRIRAIQHEVDNARRLSGVIMALIESLNPLRTSRTAGEFIGAFKEVVASYLDSAAIGFEEAVEEIDQLGTIGAVSGELSLTEFAESLAANLEARYIRPEKLGDGVVVAEYRAAAGLRFERVILCGAVEGALPAGAGTDAILDDRVWQYLKAGHPFIEDGATRVARAKEAALRAVASAGSQLTWLAPAFDAGGTKEVYPSPMMAEACSEVVGRRVTAAELRSGSTGIECVRRTSSPLAAALRGPLLNIGELQIRSAVELGVRKEIPETHPRYRAVGALRARRSGEFTEWDGNLSSLDEPGWLEIQSAVSPTSLEHYATCGYRYFGRSLLRLREIEEPDEKQTMDPLTRGSLVHTILERFFVEQRERGRPKVNEAWTHTDKSRLLEIADEVLAGARDSGQTGLDIFLQHEARTIRADLVRFLGADTLFRRETGAVPSEFEAAIPSIEVAGVTMRGYADRVDRTPDGNKAWVLDYKTGSTKSYEGMGPDDPLKGGTKLQLPIYLSIVGDTEEATALYWFITQRGGFERRPYEADGSDSRFPSTLEAIVEGIRSGSFPAVSEEENEYFNRFENCRFCEFDRICSRRRDLEFAAKEGDAGIAPWRAVSAAARGEQ